jgi:hypothetical protein
VQLHGVQNLLKNLFLAGSPKALGPIRQVVPGFPLRVGQPGQHPRGGFPTNSAVGGKVPHGVTRFLEGTQDLGDPPRFPAAGALIFDIVRRPDVNAMAARLRGEDQQVFSDWENGKRLPQPLYRTQRP